MLPNVNETTLENETHKKIYLKTMEYIALISLYIIMATLIIYDTSLKISNQILLHKLFFFYIRYSFRRKEM